MDVIFDIDGTLANAEHRLHLIMEHGAKDWETFLSDEMVIKDTAIEPIWETLSALVDAGHRVAFITGRPEKQRQTTMDWLGRHAARFTGDGGLLAMKIRLYMRADGDRRPSHEVKEELLHRARREGFAPVIVFEDRKHDAEMWRRNGLICCQVAEGDY